MSNTKLIQLPPGFFGHWGNAVSDWLKEPTNQADDETCPAHTCPVTYRLKTSEELGSAQEDLVELGGQSVSIVRFDEIDETFLCRFASGRDRWVPKDWLAKTTNHSFVQTGTRWSYCKVCDCDGQFDFESGKFVPA